MKYLRWVVDLTRPYLHGRVLEFASGNGEDAQACAPHVLEHLEEGVVALRSFAQQVRPGGAVLLFVPSFPTGMSQFDIGHVRSYRKATLRKALEDAGLQVEHLRLSTASVCLPEWS